MAMERFNQYETALANVKPTQQIKLAKVYVDENGVDADITDRILALWLPTSATPLDSFDRIRLTYVGHVPGRSTDWLDNPPRPFTHRVGVGVHVVALAHQPARDVSVGDAV